MALTFASCVFFSSLLLSWGSMESSWFLTSWLKGSNTLFLCIAEYLETEGKDLFLICFIHAFYLTQLYLPS